MTPTRSTGTKALGVLLFLGAWQLLSVVGNNRMLPGVDTVLVQLQTLMLSGELIEHAAATLSKGLIGLGLALLMGTATGIWCAHNRYANAALHPLISLLYPVPKLALYPIVVLIFGLGGESKVVQVVLECFFPFFLIRFVVEIEFL